MVAFLAGREFDLELVQCLKLKKIVKCLNYLQMHAQSKNEMI